VKESSWAGVLEGSLAGVCSRDGHNWEALHVHIGILGIGRTPACISALLWHALEAALFHWQLHRDWLAMAQK
jgi:hypothetical protein